MIKISLLLITVLVFTRPEQLRATTTNEVKVQGKKETIDQALKILKKGSNKRVSLALQKRVDNEFNIENAGGDLGKKTVSK